MLKYCTVNVYTIIIYNSLNSVYVAVGYVQTIRVGVVGSDVMNMDMVVIECVSAPCVLD